MISTSTITATDAEDLDTQLNTFEANAADTLEVTGYQILDDTGTLANNGGATGDVQKDRRALETYFTAWGFGSDNSQQVQAKGMRLSDRELADWQSLEDLAAFGNASS